MDDYTRGLYVGVSVGVALSTLAAAAVILLGTRPAPAPPPARRPTVGPKGGTGVPPRPTREK
jgi:hypothetical protein